MYQALVVVMDGVISKNCQEVHEPARFNSFIASRYLTTCTRLLFCFFRATRGEAGKGSWCWRVCYVKQCFEIITDSRISGCVCVWRIHNGKGIPCLYVCAYVTNLESSERICVTSETVLESYTKISWDIPVVVWTRTLTTDSTLQATFVYASRQSHDETFGNYMGTW
jgi:hypothetical protein